MTGMEVIRGYRAEERFITEFNGNLESFREKYTNIKCNKWKIKSN